MPCSSEIIASAIVTFDWRILFFRWHNNEQEDEVKTTALHLSVMGEMKRVMMANIVKMGTLKRGTIIGFFRYIKIQLGSEA